MKMLVVFAFLLFGNFVLAQDLKLILKAEQTEMPVGIPIIINLTIQSEKDFTLHGPFNVCDGHTGLMIRDQNGNNFSPIVEMGCAFPQMSPLDSEMKAQYQKFASTNYEFFLNPGSYQINATYVSRGPYLDRYTETDQRPIEGIWIGELTSNEVKLTVKNPEGEDQKAFLTLRPLQEELPTPENQLPWFFRVEGEQILKDYPKSNYAAWILWKNGEINYKNMLSRSMSVEEEFAYKTELEEVESTLSAYPCASRRELLGVIEAWEKLSKDFPTFFYNRPQILKGLSQAFIRNGDCQKSIPLIKELLEKYPESDEAKKVADYKAWMQQKNIWN